MGNNNSAIIVLIVGAPESGKTTLAQELIENHGGKTRILDPRGQYDGGEWPRAVISEGEQPAYQRGTIPVDAWLKERAEKRDYDLMVWDDADNYAPPFHQPLPVDHPRAIWTDYYIGHRHYGGDIIVVARRVQNLSRILLSACHTIYIFNVGEPNSRRALGEFTDAKLPRNQHPTAPYKYKCVPILSAAPVTSGETKPRKQLPKTWWRKIWEW